MFYTKSTRMYVQQGCNVQVEHPDGYQRFKEENHVVRRSDRLWSGLSVNLIIEQIMMRSTKTSGGLTRGRGMTQQQRRFTVVSKASLFEYGLCSNPPVLFDTSLLLRQPHKLVLVYAIWALLTTDLPGITGQVLYGWWCTCSEYPIYTWIHVQFVTRKYGETTVVFNGYEGTSTKAMIYQWQASGTTSPTVTFYVDMPSTMKEDEFIGNNINKQQFLTCSVAT
ncbi:hypothetical protein MAR_019414 [Mya arenaria]|uniref:Uncharacterized protein n=1 Tax=Mya arenaria TaxID=6604 RepID=A0ABY7EL33_MYAAR|nr:hypothetical protein MAR_019414 [Mya arenaria]